MPSAAGVQAMHVTLMLSHLLVSCEGHKGVHAVWMATCEVLQPEGIVEISHRVLHSQTQSEDKKDDFAQIDRVVGQ